MIILHARSLLIFAALIAVPVSALADNGAKFDVCDVSFLWPVPTTPEEAQQLISLDERLTEDEKAVCPQPVFDTLIRHAKALQLTDPVSGEVVQIEFPDDGLKLVSNWKIAGIRIDPSAPGCSSKIRIDQGFGSVAQIRIVAQPVTVEGDKAKAHDFTAHLVFHYSRNNERPFEADKSRFQEVVDDLLAIKEELKEAGIDTSGAKLGVHPGFLSSEVDLTALVKKLLKDHLSSNRLNAAAFMGIQDGAEPWIFFATSRNPVTGDFELVANHPSIRPSPGQALSLVTATTVFPEPTNHQFATTGLSTQQLFLPANPERRAFPDSDDPLLSTFQVKHIADIVANPEMSHFFTTDCVSCHSESSLRDFKLGGATTRFAFKLPEGISGVDPNLLPRTDPTFQAWNVRNFGWGFKVFRGNMTPTVTMRTANEAAESADFINNVYLSDPVSGSIE